MKKRLISIALVLTMLFALAPAVFAAGETAKLVVSDAVGKIGEDSTVTVDVTYKNDVPMTSVRFHVISDLKIVDVTTDYTCEPNADTNDILVYDIGKIPANVVICSITFDLDVDAATAKSSYEVALNIVDSSDNINVEPFDIESVAGTITIASNVMPGDINLSGTLSNVDLVQLARYLVETKELTPAQILNADVNGNGKVTNSDLVRLAKILVED